MLPFISSGHLTSRCLSPQLQTCSSRFHPLTPALAYTCSSLSLFHTVSLPKSFVSVRSLPPSLLLCRGAPSVRRQIFFASSYPLPSFHVAFLVPQNPFRCIKKPVVQFTAHLRIPSIIHVCFVTVFTLASLESYSSITLKQR